MNRLIAGTLALAFALAAGRADAHHPCVQYVKVPLISGANGFSVPSAGFGGFSYGLPASSFGLSMSPSYSFGLPVSGFGTGLSLSPSSAFSFGLPASSFGFGVPASNFSLSLTPNTSASNFSLSLNPNSGGASSLSLTGDSQGLLDQVILPMLLRNFLGNVGNNGSTPTGQQFKLTSDQVKQIGDQIVNSASLSTVSVKLDNTNKWLRDIGKKLGVPPPADLVPIPAPTTPSGSGAAPARDDGHTEFLARVTAMKSTQASWKETPAAATQTAEKLSEKFETTIADIKAIQASWKRPTLNNATAVSANRN